MSNELTYQDLEFPIFCNSHVLGAGGSSRFSINATGIDNHGPVRGVVVNVTPTPPRDEK